MLHAKDVLLQRIVVQFRRFQALHRLEIRRDALREIRVSCSVVKKN